MLLTYDILTLISVILLQSDPRSWPPLMDSPWLSTSLHEFWGRRWHQLLRRPFLLVGGVPFTRIHRSLFGKASKNVETSQKQRLSPSALAFGTFLASGLHHSLMSYSTLRGRPYGFGTVLFFVAQSLGLALEREWRNRTGKRVVGFSGRIWTALWLVVWAQLFSKCHIQCSQTFGTVILALSY